jgi:hypothetical protein
MFLLYGVSAYGYSADYNDTTSNLMPSAISSSVGYSAGHNDTGAVL